MYHENKMYCNKCTKMIIPSQGYYHDKARTTLCWTCLAGSHKDHLDFDSIVSPILENDPKPPVRDDGYSRSSPDYYHMSDDLLVNLHQMLENSSGDGWSPERNESMEMFPIPSPQEVDTYLQDYVIGQENARKTLSVVVSNHRAICQYNADNPRDQLKKSNLLIMGPSGTGKTLMIEKVAKFLQVPYVSTSATEYTESGYVGKDVEQVLLMLMENAGGDRNLAENGIVFIDEIDKILATSTSSGNKDVSGAGVQHALLRMVEGGIINVSDPAMRGHTGPGKPFDTSNLLFVFGGAFTNLRESKLEVKNQLGFGKEEEVVKDLIITADDLVEAGMIREFVGRVHHIVSTEAFTDEDLLKILTAPKDSIISQHEKLMRYKKLGNLNLREDKFLKELVKDSKELGTGARGLKVVLEKKLLDLYYKG